MKIMHRGVAIVLLPFLVNVVLVCTLTVYVNDAAAGMQRTRAASRVASDLAYSMYYCTGLLGSGSNGALNGSFGILANVLNEMLDRLGKSTAEAARHSSGQPYQKNVDYAVANIAKAAAFERAIVAGGNIPGHEDEAITIKAKRVTPWREIAVLDSKLLKSTLNTIGGQVDRDAVAERVNESVSRSIIIGGMVSNLLLACFLVAIFNRSIVDRILKLGTNARTIPTYKPLPERVPGRDELGELGKALEIVSQRTIEAMEYRQTLMQMMAHDLRSPLAAGKISLEILDRKKAGAVVPQDLREVEKLKSNLDVCLSLINNLLVLETFENKRVEMDLQPENIYELVQSTLEDTTSNLPTAQGVVVNKCAHIYISGDRHYLTMMLKIMIVNALQRTATISTPRVVLTTELEANNSRHILLHCADNGPRINDKAKQQLFNKFATDSAGQLGLIVCRLIAQHHGGQFSVNSREETTFSLTLPYSRERDQEEEDEEEEEEDDEENDIEGAEA